MNLVLPWFCLHDVMITRFKWGNELLAFPCRISCGICYSYIKESLSLHFSKLLKYLIYWQSFSQFIKQASSSEIFHVSLRRCKRYFTYLLLWRKRHTSSQRQRLRCIEDGLSFKEVLNINSSITWFMFQKITQNLLKKRIYEKFDVLKREKNTGYDFPGVFK